MKKPFLLIAGDYIYPNADTEDWVKCFSTETEALEAVESVTQVEYFTRGKMKGQVKSTDTTYEVEGRWGKRKCDWFEIVDLREWADE